MNNAPKTTPILSLPKETIKGSHPVAGPFVENLYTTYSVTEFFTGRYAGMKFLSRTTRNDYVIVSSCQWGDTDSKRIAGELGVTF